MRESDAEFERLVVAMVTEEEIDIAAQAMAYKLGRLYGAALPRDRAELRGAARAALLAVSRLRAKKSQTPT